MNSVSIITKVIYLSYLAHFGLQFYLSTSNPCLQCTLGRVDEYPTMQHFGNPRHIQSMMAYMILTEYFWKFQ